MKQTISKIITWIAVNKEWIFSGIGIILITYFFNIFRKNKKNPNDIDKITKTQTIEGNNNTTYQNVHNSTITDNSINQNNVHGDNNITIKR